jgi:flagellar biosynthesis/type III secretory pathway protein FliH
MTGSDSRMANSRMRAECLYFSAIAGSIKNFSPFRLMTHMRADVSCNEDRGRKSGAMEVGLVMSELDDDDDDDDDEEDEEDGVEEEEEDEEGVEEGAEEGAEEGVDDGEEDETDDHMG